MARASWLVLVAAALAHADAAPPALPTETEGAALLERWRKAQNDGDFAAYQALYADPFTGVRRSGTRKATFDRAGWLADRARMFKKKMTVTVEKVRTAKSADGLVARFTQTWESGAWRDAGDKELLLVRQGGEVRIAREEQLGTRRLGAGGAPTLVVWPAKTAAAAEAARAEWAKLTAALAMIAHAPTVVDGVGLVLGACDDGDLEPVLATFHALAPRVESRPAPAGTRAGCPSLAVNPDTRTGWSWPQIEEKRVGRATVTLLALQRDEDEAGDFARNYKETAYVAVLRGPDGALLDVASGGSGAEFAWFTQIEAAGAGFAVREEFVDEPCDGAHRHRQRRYERTLRFTVDGARVGEQ